MLKSFYYLIIILAIATGCSDQQNTYKICVSQCSQGPWREKVNREMLAAQHLYEQDVKVDIVNSYDNTDLQIRQIDSMANTDIDLMVIAPNEAAPIAEAITRVRAKGIPVIYFDRKAATEDYTAFIGGNNVWAGETVGEYAIKLARQITGHKPVVLEITATMGTSPARERHEGFSRMMQVHPELEYVCIFSDWSSEKAYEIMKQQIKKNQLPDIVFCHNDGMTTGAWRAINEAKLKERIKLLGIDGMPDEGIKYVQQGKLDGTYVYPTHGEEIVRLALDIMTGKKFERDNSMKGVMVTPEDADIIALNSHELIKQNDDLITIHDKLEQYFGLYNAQHKMLIFSFVCIGILLLAVIMAVRAYLQTRKAIRQRQAMNEEQTLFYTDASNRKLHEIFLKQEEELPPPRSQDMLFAEQLNEAIRNNMRNPNMKMDELGEKLGLSRVQLYRKVKAITGKTPVELLRQMRLQQAYALLGSTTKTVAEIAYEVGFATPGYFSKCFKEQFGKYPTDLRAE